MPLRIAPASLRFGGLVGVGGIGSGSFFALSGNHTLGREESRGGRFLDRRDYCKLHIVAHYAKVLLGPGFEVYPIGKVGDDEVGARLLAEMRAAGLDTTHVSVSPGDQTLFSFCFVYPDGSGGNLTTDDSACARVDAASVAVAEPTIARLGTRGIAAALPEVPLEARRALLDAATRHGLFRVASFASGEVRAAADAGLLGSIDLLALNVDEAAALTALPEGSPPEAVAPAAVNALAERYPRLCVTVTAGKGGSWCWDTRRLTQAAAPEVEALGTAGAGDAFLSGILAGLAAGLPLSQAHSLGVLVAAFSVTSPHTIHPGMDRVRLRDLASECALRLGPAVAALLEDDEG